jgi:hypothetical protein
MHLPYMRIAWCLYGQPRCYTEGYKYVRELMDKYPSIQFDFFIHCWYSEADVGKTYQHSHYRDVPISALTIHANTDKHILELYNPVAYTFEPVKEFDSEFIYDTLIDDRTTSRQKTNYNNVFSNIYSKYKVDQLLQSHNATYDLVIETRFDYLNHFTVDLYSINLAHLHVIYHNQSRIVINDSYIITNPTLFHHYSQAYVNLHRFIDNPHIQDLAIKHGEYYNFVPETILFCNLLYIYGEHIVTLIEKNPQLLNFFA